MSVTKAHRQVTESTCVGTPNLFETSRGGSKVLRVCLQKVWGIGCCELAHGDEHLSHVPEVASGMVLFPFLDGVALEWARKAVAVHGALPPSGSSPTFCMAWSFNLGMGFV